MNENAAAKCRGCSEGLSTVLVDLGMSPLCESYVHERDLNSMERFYPLKVWVCEKCWLVQLEEYVSPDEIFTQYDYFSSYSTSWVAHARQYTDMITDRLGLTGESWVVEVASNDGYLLQHFVEKSIPCLGIEPAKNVAKAASAKGIECISEFFGRELASDLVSERGKADLVLGNNVLAHVPDIHDFVTGLSMLIAEDGVVTVEFPHLVKLVEENQFDTIYHEHFCYLSFFVVEKIFEEHGLRVFDVEEIPTHGGSLRVFACLDGSERFSNSESVSELREREFRLGYNDAAVYKEFEDRVRETKRKLLQFLIEAKESGQQVVGYGAPGKGNTLLNYCGIRTDFLDFTVDRSAVKQGAFTPGTHIPILEPEFIDTVKPDYLLILPWNLRDEIEHSMSHIRKWGGKFVVPIPEVEVF